MNLVADANVLLAAILGGRARLVLVHPHIEEVFTTESTFAEVQEYAPILARKRNLTADILLLAVAALPVTVFNRDRYSAKIAEARHRIGRRDPDDVDLLALALHLKVPIWSNDKDFEGLRVELLTTENLLRRLRLID